MHQPLCLNCLQPLNMVHVHGHYQCAYCGMNTMPCCDGDNASTNWLMNGNEPCPLPPPNNPTMGDSA